MFPLDIPPGIVKTRSPNAAGGRFTDSDKVRFVNGKPEKWKGWIKLIDQSLLGIARGMVSWANSFGTQNIAVGTHLKLYVIKSGDLVDDITPIRSSGTLGSDPFDVTDGETEVIVNHSSNGADQNAFVTFSGADPVGGITIDGEYQIARKIDNDSYAIEHPSPATSTASGGGSSVEYEYQINPGNPGSIIGLGWGAGPWGAETWGTPRTASGLTLSGRHWSLAEYGNELLALPSSQTLFLWEEATDDRAEAVTNAPSSARAMFVTGERFIFLLGTSTPMTVQWPDRDDITDWTPGLANTANIRPLQSGSKLIAGTRLADLVSLIWSDTSLYVFQYTGSEFIYDDRLVGIGCGLSGPLAFVVVAGVAYWMSGHNFHQYSGSVGPIFRSEEVRAYVFDSINKEHVDKIWGLHDQNNQQIRWHYCSENATEPDRYVDVSLVDYSWTVGSFDGTSGAIYRPIEGLPITIDANGDLYLHGVGNDADTAAMNSHITYGLYSIDQGNSKADVTMFVPDFERQTGAVTIELFGKDRPDSTNLDEKTITLSPGAEDEDIRLEARYFGFTVRSNVLGGDFRVGNPQLEIGEAGQR